MNRKLHHSLSAFAAAAAFLVLGLVAAVPGVSSTSAQRSVQAATPAVLTTVVTAPVASRAGKSARRQRHRIVMPYFSFSSRS